MNLPGKLADCSVQTRNSPRSSWSRVTRPAVRPSRPATVRPRRCSRPRKDHQRRRAGSTRSCEQRDPGDDHGDRHRHPRRVRHRPMPATTRSSWRPTPTWTAPTSGPLILTSSPADAAVDRRRLRVHRRPPLYKRGNRETYLDKESELEEPALRDRLEGISGHRLDRRKPS